MKTYPTEKIRNVLLFGHQSTGKTSLAEALYFASGATTRQGTIEDGNTVCDFEPEETKKQISVSLAMVPVEWEDHKINLLDSPGYLDFIGEVKAALRVTGLAVLVVSAVDGVQVGHELFWSEARHLGIPSMVFVNKLDRERASFERTLDEISSKLGTGFAPLQVPIGSEADFSGVADVLDLKAFTYSGDPKGNPEDVPDDLKAQIEDLNTQIVESVAESDDALLEKYLEGEELEQKEVANGLAKGLLDGNVFPVLAGSATKLIGVDRLAHFITEEGPPPSDRRPSTGKKPGTDEEITRKTSPDEPVSAFVFKTVSDPYVGQITLLKVASGTIRPDTELLNVSRGNTEKLHQIFTLKGKEQESVSEVPAGDIAAVAKLSDTHSGDTLADQDNPIEFPRLEPPDRSLARAIEPRTKGDEDKLMTGLSKLQEEDPALDVERNPETKQTLLWGTGDAHLDVTLERLHRKFGVEVDEVDLRIPYRETIKKPGKGMGRHVKQSGGHGQYAICHLEVEPHDDGFEFENKIYGGAIPSQFIPGVQKGVEKAMSEGVAAGYPMDDVKVRLVDGKHHPVDSSDIAFQIAGAAGMREAANDAGVVLLEPIMDLEVMVPDSMLGDIMGDLNGKRGRIEGTESIGGRQLVKAKVPMAEVARYAIDLRSMTAGQGTFRVDFSHYDEVPAHLVDGVIANAKQDD